MYFQYEALEDVFPALREKAQLDRQISELEMFLGEDDDERHDTVSNVEFSAGDEQGERDEINIKQRNKTEAKKHSTVASLYGPGARQQHSWGGGYVLSDGTYISDGMAGRIAVVLTVAAVVSLLAARGKQSERQMTSRMAELERQLLLMQGAVWRMHGAAAPAPTQNDFSFK